MKQGTKEWLEWRKKHIGASDQTHLHWSAPWSKGWGYLWDVKNEVTQEEKPNEWMRQGIERENEARFIYSMEKSLEVEPYIIEHAEFKYLSASLDVYNPEHAHVAEIKCPNQVDHSLAKAGVIPQKYIPQLCHQYYVTNAQSLDYVSFDGDNIAVVPYARDNKLITEIMNAAHKFWAFVAEGNRPDREYPHPLFDTRIPEIDDATLLSEAKNNLELRNKLDWLEMELDASNERLLSGTQLARAKIGGVQIVTRGTNRSVKRSSTA